MKLPYSEGSVFLVPVGRRRYARGVVARSAPRGRILFGYFFGPALKSIRSARVDDLSPDRAILRVQFGDLGLVDGTWRVVGRVPDWDRSRWPMPDFVRRDLLGYKKPILVRRSDTDPSEIEAEYTVDDDAGLAADALSGSGAVEIALSKLLDPPEMRGDG